MKFQFYLYIKNIEVYFLVFGLLGLIGCNSTSLKLKDDINDITGRHISFPDQIDYWAYDSTTFQMEKENFTLNHELKIIAIIDIDCSACVGEIDEWEKALKEKKLKKDLVFIFIIKTVDPENFSQFIRHKKISDAYVAYDSSNEIFKINSFSNYKTLQTMLLDNDNRVILVGNPLNNKSLIKLYNREIVKRITN